jgi:hypothetical protein
MAALLERQTAACGREPTDATGGQPALGDLSIMALLCPPDDVAGAPKFNVPVKGLY